MPATAWLLGIANPQSIKRLGHFLTADNISAGTPNGGKDISGATDLTPRANLVPSGCVFITLLSYFSFAVFPLSHRYAGCSLVAGDCKSPEHKEVRTFFDSG